MFSSLFLILSSFIIIMSFHHQFEYNLMYAYILHTYTHLHIYIVYVSGCKFLINTYAISIYKVAMTTCKKNEISKTKNNGKIIN